MKHPSKASGGEQVGLAWLILILMVPCWEHRDPPTGAAWKSSSQSFFPLLSGPCQDHGEFGRRHMASTLWCLYSLASGDVFPGSQTLGVYPWALDKVLQSLNFCILLTRPLLDLLKPWKIFS